MAWDTWFIVSLGPDQCKYCSNKTNTLSIQCLITKTAIHDYRIIYIVHKFQRMQIIGAFYESSVLFSCACLPWDFKFIVVYNYYLIDILWRMLSVFVRMGLFMRCHRRLHCLSRSCFPSHRPRYYNTDIKDSRVTVLIPHGPQDE